MGALWRTNLQLLILSNSFAICLNMIDSPGKHILELSAKTYKKENKQSLSRKDWLLLLKLTVATFCQFQTHRKLKSGHSSLSLRYPEPSVNYPGCFLDSCLGGERIALKTVRKITNRTTVVECLGRKTNIIFEGS